MIQPPFAWVEISRSALLGNARLFKHLIGPRRRLMAIIKSNAYGHGFVPTARIIQNTVDWLGVVNLDEALELRRHGIAKPILVLSYYHPSEAILAIRRRIDLSVGSFQQLQNVIRLTNKVKRPLRVHLKCDVGTGRIGFLPNDVPKALQLIKRSPQLRLIGVFAHLADSENRDQSFTNRQNGRFEEIYQQSITTLNAPLVRHIACTASALVNPATLHDLARVGLGLYGLWPSRATRTHSALSIQKLLRPAMAWKTRLISIKRLPTGSNVGYGRTCRLARSTSIGVIPVGYYEGYPRLLSNQARVLIHGRYAPVVGRICMNMTMIDLNGVPKTSIGDEVVLIGRQGRGEVTADELADRSRTINYEIVTRINPGLPRLIVT